jgi:hypothetical protein
MDINWEYCSLYYLQQWLSGERRLHDALSGTDERSIREGLSDAVKSFRVARNLPRKYDADRGLKRYEPLLEVFLQLQKQEISESNFINVFDNFQSEISKKYGGKKLISLSSKLLWLRYRDPFIIYDSRARTSLEVTPGDYSEYVAEWLKSFQPHQERIAAICSELSSVYRYVEFEYNESNFAEIKNVSNEEWFHKRVFDIYLWRGGERARAARRVTPDR